MLLNKSIPLNYIFKEIRLKMLYVFIIGVVVYFFTTVFRDVIPIMPLTIPTFLGTAISVLLSFKLGQSYDRWWEARRIWGSIVNDSRTLVLQLQSFLSPGNGAAITKIGLRQIGWCFCLGQSLREEANPLANMEKYLDEADIESLKQHTNKPLAMLQMHNEDVAALRAANQLDVFTHVQLNTTLVNLTNSMGMAERIKSTVFPATYRLFLHMIIYVFVVTLSIALIDLETYYELPLLMTIAAFFFLLERASTHLQDPFSNMPTDTAMTAIATNIEINIKQLLGRTDVPQPLKPSGFYLN